MDEVFYRTELCRLEGIINKLAKRLTYLETDLNIHVYNAEKDLSSKPWEKIRALSVNESNGDNEAVTG